MSGQIYEVLCKGKLLRGLGYRENKWAVTGCGGRGFSSILRSMSRSLGIVDTIGLGRDAAGVYRVADTRVTLDVIVRAFEWERRRMRSRRVFPACAAGGGVSGDWVLPDAPGRTGPVSGAAATGRAGVAGGARRGVESGRVTGSAAGVENSPRLRRTGRGCCCANYDAIGKKCRNLSNCVCGPTGQVAALLLFQGCIGGQTRGFPSGF